jgi:hypothetical protein
MQELLEGYAYDARIAATEAWAVQLIASFLLSKELSLMPANVRACRVSWTTVQSPVEAMTLAMGSGFVTARIVVLSI